MKANFTHYPDGYHPEEILSRELREFPKVNQHVNHYLSLREDGLLDDWAEWCLLPLGGWFSIAAHLMQEKQGRQIPEQELTMLAAAKVSTVAALGTWQYTKSIFQIDPELSRPLIDCNIDMKIPSDVLKRLPEWCVYIDAQDMGLTYHVERATEVLGFWAHLEHDSKDGHAELRLLLNTRNQSAKHVGPPDQALPELIAVPLHIGEWSIRDAVNKCIDVAEKQLGAIGMNPFTAGFKYDRNAVSQQMAKDVAPLISLLLYLCSDEPDIDDKRTPGESVGNPSRKKTKKGRRIFPAKKARTFFVGEQIGKKVRAGRAGAGVPSGLTMPTHVRKAHWHGFWKGKRDSQDQRFFYKFIMPIVINAPSEDGAKDDA